MPRIRAAISTHPDNASFAKKGWLPVSTAHQKEDRDHFSTRNNIWQKKNPWFRRDVLPALLKRVKKAQST